PVSHALPVLARSVVPRQRPRESGEHTMNRMRTLMGRDRQAALGLLVLGGLVVVTLAVFSGIPRKAYDNRGDTVKVVFPTTGVMSTKTRVRVNGVPVGKVKKMSLNPGGRSATVELAVRK